MDLRSDMEKRPPSDVEYRVTGPVMGFIEKRGWDSMVPKRMHRVEAYIGETRVGNMRIWKEELPTFGPIVRAEYVLVEPGYYRKGIGTGLYEAAARAACSEYGAPLASAGTRTRFSSGFWKKQVRKGRAKRLAVPKSATNPSGIAYALSCPAPMSLGLRGVLR